MKPRWRPILARVCFNRQGGAAIVEFAIVLGILVLIVAGIIEFGRVFWYYDALTKATRDGARYLSTSTLPLDTTVTKNIVVNAADAANVGDSVSGKVVDGNVSISCTPDCNAPEYVTVAIGNPATSYSVALGEWLPFAGSATITLQPYTTMRYMQ